MCCGWFFLSLVLPDVRGERFAVTGKAPRARIAAQLLKDFYAKARHTLSLEDVQLECVGAGLLFGNIPVIKENFSLVTIGIVVVSLLPIAIGWIKRGRRSEVRGQRSEVSGRQSAVDGGRRGPHERQWLGGANCAAFRRIAAGHGTRLSDRAARPAADGHPVAGHLDVDQLIEPSGVGVAVLEGANQGGTRGVGGTRDRQPGKRISVLERSRIRKN